MTPAALARLRADLAEAQQRRDSLDYQWQRAKYTSSGGSDTPEDLDVELARVEADIAEFEERFVQAGAALTVPPTPAARPAVDLAAPPANDAPAFPATPEFLTTREAAALLGVSVKGLEALRARGEGPPFVRVGRAVRYRRDDLRTAK